MNKREIGGDKEHIAEEYLTALGMKILQRNFRTRFGEIDLIMKDRRTLVFIEVKYRAGDTAGTALEAIDIRKRKQIGRIALHYLALHREYINSQMRFDCVGINGNDISYVRNAFDVKGNIL